MAREIYRFFRNIPLAGDGIQAGVLMGIGDTIAQAFVEKKDVKELDWKRTSKFFVIGTLFVGPPLRLWYGFLHKHITGGSKIVAMKKVMIDQLFFAPCFMGMVLTVINFSQGHSASEILDKLKLDYVDILMNNYKVWPAIQLMNFYVVPLKFQVATVQTVAIFWNTYISWKTNKSSGISDEMTCSTGIS